MHPPVTADILVAFSGGLDSTVLLHRLTACNPGRVRALHVHHGLHADAGAWAAHCRHACDALGVALAVEHVQVDSGGLGREGAARAARHDAFARVLGVGEVLALAHHREDQAETFLLRALRGSGTDGLAAMRAWRAYARGWLWRPLLDTPHAALRGYAEEHGLAWIDDPSNGDSSLDRNFLRNQVLPLLRTRWPRASDAFARSAALSAASGDLLDDEDAVALAAVRDTEGNIKAVPLLALPVARRSRVLRRWVAELDLPPLPGNGIATIEHELLAPATDAGARFDWAGARIERWRDLLHASPIPVALPQGWSRAWDGREPLHLPTGGSLRLLGASGFDAPLRAHARQGGERMLLPNRNHHHTLKHVLQDRGVPPWRRDGMPLLSDAAGDLHAAGDDILSSWLDGWLQARSARLYWNVAAPEDLPGPAW